MRGLDGKVAMVVGGGSGIGRAAARRLAEEGASVAVVDVAADAADATAAGIAAAGGRGLALHADATAPEDVDRAVDRVVTDLGGIDVLVNSVARVPRRTMYDITPQEWQDTVDACLFSYFLTTRAALPHLVARGGGKIVNVCSVTAHVGAQLPAYSAAKGAVLSWSREIAVEFAHHGITVNTVSPGVIETPINTEVLRSDAVRATMLDAIPLGRFGRPEDVAATIAFLASSDADFVSGTDVVVDGAMIASTSWGTARTAWRTHDAAR
ncbi:SDR family NAD(P)-dependent oxidoreductase [Pseudonocardia broussonetiae]|uniref:SDR family oxidoreductase n=1 Tax=Pseudonocardia broussonetiae TaxID=2736640 RepID=A0A6M6JJS7_9PSEU|nr:SDR family NAD(P)-dependent oxidoreductase [Pseudonocardia broussonetiae]QJY47413.1 SDR family oxidoreductase [Pseudonocardia broussonetiae]